MAQEKNKMPLIIEFVQGCKEFLLTPVKPARSDRRRLEAYRPKFQSLLNDPYHGAVVENCMKMLNVIQHYAKSDDVEQLQQSLAVLAKECTELLGQAEQKIKQKGGK